MTSSLDSHLASFPCTAGTRALAAHVRDDHGKDIFTIPYEGTRPSEVSIHPDRDECA